MRPASDVIPTIREVYVSPPIVVHTDNTNFRLVVQTLTGKRKTPCVEASEILGNYNLKSSPCAGSNLPINLYDDQGESGYHLCPQSDIEVSTCACASGVSQGCPSTLTQSSIDYLPCASPAKKSKTDGSHCRRNSICMSIYAEFDEVMQDLLDSEMFCNETVLGLRAEIPQRGVAASILNGADSDAYFPGYYGKQDDDIMESLLWL